MRPVSNRVDCSTRNAIISRFPARNSSSCLRSRSIPRSMIVRALADDGSLGPGVKVRVKVPLVVYHVPKQSGGLDLEGMEGSIVADAREHEKFELSANLPWKIQFQKPGETGKRAKFFAHLREDEIEVIG